MEEVGLAELAVGIGERCQCAARAVVRQSVWTSKYGVRGGFGVKFGKGIEGVGLKEGSGRNRRLISARRGSETVWRGERGSGLGSGVGGGRSEG